MSFYQIDKIDPWLYRINDPLNVCFYLLDGNDRALLFDTGFGVGNILETIRTVTSKPVRCNNRYVVEERASGRGTRYAFCGHCRVYALNGGKVREILYTQQINVIVNDFSANIAKPLLVIGSNIAVLVVLFVVAYKKRVAWMT